MPFSPTGSSSASTTAAARSSLAPKRSNVFGVILLIVGVVAMVVVGIYGYIESRRVESILVAARDIPYGTQITLDDLKLIDVPYYRPVPIEGITEPSLVVGTYAARAIFTNDVLRVDMVTSIPPDTPVYPNGKPLPKNMVAVPLALTNVGPINDNDLLNIGFTAADPTLCDRTAADVPLGQQPPMIADVVTTQNATMYACRYMSGIEILYIADDVAYLLMTPAQALSLRAVQAGNVMLWVERYPRGSDPLLYMERLYAGQVILPELTRPVTETLRPEPQRLPSYAPPIGQPITPPTEDSSPGDQSSEETQP